LISGTRRSSSTFVRYIHCTKNTIYVFPDMNMQGLLPNSYIQKNRQTDPENIEAAQFHFWEYINRNQTFILDSHRPSFAVYTMKHMVCRTKKSQRRPNLVVLEIGSTSLPLTAKTGRRAASPFSLLVFLLFVAGNGFTYMS
jgi:hypothetical protein